jgi:hypothetical protein
MKASQVIAQLQTVLPQLTNLFSDEIEVLELYQKDGIAYLKTKEKNNFKTGNYINISGVRTKNKVTSLTRTGNKATALLSYPHDITLGYQLTANISGADQDAYNGNKQLTAVNGISQITFQVAGVPASPATGDIYLNELRMQGFNGWQQITVIDDRTFSYPLVATLPYLVPEVSNAVCRYNLRISGQVSAERAIDSYTQYLKSATNTQNILWAYVVLENVDVSKDRNIETDTSSLSQGGTRILNRLINRFSIYVFCPTTNNISEMKARDLMEDVAVYLWGSVLRIKFPTGLSTYPWSETTTFGHELYHSNTAFIVQRYKFEAVSDITYADTSPPDANAALREIDFTYLNPAADSDYVEMAAIAKLNDDN